MTRYAEANFHYLLAPYLILYVVQLSGASLGKRQLALALTATLSAD